MPSKSRDIAVLIDGDNAQPSLIENLLAEAAKHGRVMVRRIYGDWTAPNMSKWKTMLNSHAVHPVQQFRYTTGKNATDIALVIEAMDLMYAGVIGGFCIVSSDSDYTRLAIRIREQGLFVMGIGGATTPQSFVNACEVFVRTEHLTPKPQPKQQTKEVASADWIPMVKKAIAATAQNNGWASLGAVGGNVHKTNPDFSHKNYGYKQLSQLLKSEPSIFETKGDPSAIQVRVKAR